MHSDNNVKTETSSIPWRTPLKEGRDEGVVKMRKLFCYEWQEMSPYLVSIRNIDKNSFSILMS